MLLSSNSLRLHLILATSLSLGFLHPFVASAQTEFQRADNSALLVKVVGLSDNIPITSSPDSTDRIGTLDTLKPYFVLNRTETHYRVSDRQSEGGNKGVVASDEVAEWNTREGLHFLDDAFLRDRRATVSAWSSEERIRNYAASGDLDNFGPTFQEGAQTRVGTRGIIPYPLLDTRTVEGRGGRSLRVHKVLIPAVVQGSGTIETNLSAEEVQAIAGAVSICIVFDATASMKKYAQDFAATIDNLLSSLDVDTSLAAAGFVLFRDLGERNSRFEIQNPMPLPQAMGWLRQRANHMTGGDDPAEPVLDAVALAQTSFLWNGGTAVRGARRIVILVANDAAKPKTVQLSPSVPEGLGPNEVGEMLLRSGIPVFALQAGAADKGNLKSTLSTLAQITGGEFYPADLGSEQISESFAGRLENVVSAPIAEGSEAARRIREQAQARSQGGTVIPLDVLDEETRSRLRSVADEYYVADGGLVITPAWVFDDPSLYTEKILVEKELLEWLVRFFSELTDMSLDGPSLQRTISNLLEALAGESIGDDAEIQDLLEKRLGIHFSTNLLNFEMEYLARLSPKSRLLLQEEVRGKTSAISEFLEWNIRAFEQQSRLWMPVSYLP